jgi:hypothetical protein
MGVRYSAGLGRSWQGASSPSVDQIASFLVSISSFSFIYGNDAQRRKAILLKDRAGGRKKPQRVIPDVVRLR